MCGEMYDKLGNVSRKAWKKRNYCDMKCLGRSMSKNPNAEKYLGKSKEEIEEIKKDEGVQDEVWVEFMGRFLTNCGQRVINTL